MINKNDKQILRDLARKVAEIAEMPEMEEKRVMWTKQNQLQRVRPMIYVSPEGSWRELLPDSSLRCEGDKARSIEKVLSQRIYYYEHIKDDLPIEKNWFVHKAIYNTGWGIEPKHNTSSMEHGAWGFEPVINEPEDLKKIKIPEVIYDEKKTMADLNEIQDLFGDILNVGLKGISHISFHLMAQYCDLRGLEQVMMDMYDEPNMLHEAMSIFEEGHQNLIKQYREMNLFSLNNDETYHSSGGVGYTSELPKDGFNPNRVRTCDMWSSSEAQEMAYVSAEMHNEFVLTYEKRLLQHFGLNGYGCCEDLTTKLDYVFAIPNLRRISISPWADVEKCAQKLKGNYIFSWKPQPAHLVGNFDRKMISEYIRHTLEVTKDCVIEMILKDTHTCENHPERFTEWVQIARELVEEYN